MDKSEARAVLDQRVRELRQHSYEQLLDRFLIDEPPRRDPTWEELRGPSGTRYWLKIYAYWDSDARDDVRVWVDIEDASRRWFQPSLGDDFIVAPDDSFVGE